MAEVARQKASEIGREHDLLLDLRPVALALGDRDLRKIVEELVDNAFKFSQPGTPVRLHLGRNAAAVALTISDCGRGMTPEEIAVTQAYVQFNRVIHEQQGMGLGLTIAKQLVTLYGGTLSIDSEPGHRTMVSVVLPATKPADIDSKNPTAQ